VTDVCAQRIDQGLQGLADHRGCSQISFIMKCDGPCRQGTGERVRLMARSTLRPR